MKKWIRDCVVFTANGTFEDTDLYTMFWEVIGRMEHETNCDPIRAFRYVNTEQHRDSLIISFSYFSVAAIGILLACEKPEAVKGFLLIGQDEEMDENRHLRNLSLLNEPIDVFIRAVCEYSIDFDNRFRKLIQNVPSETHKPVAD
tara:strand:- start:331 stop:765 length:435 start_codon:yes stop_codon:yes gene_type:complete